MPIAPSPIPQATRALDAQVSATAPAGDSADPLRGAETILLAEDDEAVRAIARHMLVAFGYHVVEARTPADALQICRQHDGPIQVLLADVVMPRMNGFELAREALVIRPDLKVVFMSGYPHQTVAERGVGQPGSAFLQKPFTPAQLAGAVRAVVDAVI